MKDKIEIPIYEAIAILTLEKMFSPPERCKRIDKLIIELRIYATHGARLITISIEID